MGSFALSKDSSDLFLMCSQANLDGFAETINTHLIPKFIDWNFGTGKYPKLAFEPLADDTKAAMMEVFTALSQAATTQVSPDFIWELEKRVSDQLGLAIDYEALDAERDEALAMESSVAEALAALQNGGLGPAQDDPFASDDEDEIALAEGMGLFLVPDVQPYELADAASRIDLAEEDARRGRQADKSKRDKLGQFARLNELGRGAGLGDKADLAGVTADIQARLRSLGLDLGDFGDDGVDGKYGPATAAAVREFQDQNGLPTTGRVDLGTYALLLEQAPKVATPKKARYSKGTQRAKFGGVTVGGSA